MATLFNVLQKFALQNGALVIYWNKFKDVFHSKFAGVK